MYPVKQSTALTVPFFAHDANGDGVTGMTDGGFTKRISKNGGAFAAMTVTITEMENGWYSFPLSTSHTDTNGILSISLSNASCKRVNLQYRVSTRIWDDVPNLGTNAPTNWINAAAIASSAITSAKIATDAIGATQIAANAITSAKIAASAIGATQIATDAITAAKIAANAIGSSEIAASALNGKGDWNIGKTGYSLTQSFPSNFADLSISATTGLVDITQAAADKAWSTAARTLTANTNLNDPTAATTAAAVWDALQSSHTTGGSFGEIATEIGNILADTNELQTDDVPGLIAALNDIAASDVLTQVNTALDTAIAELGVGVPTATPTLRTGLMLLYMALRNQTITQTSGTDALEIHNDAGTKICSKALTDDGSDYTEAKMISG